MRKKIVIIGGGAGGASCAARCRRLSETAEITIIEKGQFISFASCGLPYFIGEVIANREILLLHTPESMKREFNIQVKIQSEVIEINRDEKIVKVKDLTTGGTYQVNYDVLVLSPVHTASFSKNKCPFLINFSNSSLGTLIS